MRDVLVSILAVLAIAGPTVSSDVKDVNYYKDYLRARSDEVISEGPERMLYFYRTPIQYYPGLLPLLQQEYRKRTGNAFKNHMLSKEWADAERMGKRSSKIALSQMLQGKHGSILEELLNDNSTA